MTKKRVKPRKGETVEINFRPVFSTEEGFNAVDAEVVDVLSEQFTCTTPDGSTQFRFYKDKGSTWRFKE